MYICDWSSDVCSSDLMPCTLTSVDVVLAATQNQTSSGQRRACSTSTIDNESMALIQCPFVLSAPTLMGHFYTPNAILRMPLTLTGVDVVLAATPNQAPSVRRRACSTSTIDNESMALMQCHFIHPAPTIMGHFYSLNNMLQSPHRTRGGKMWCWRPPQISHHQDGDKLVAPPPSILRAWL